MVSQLGYNQPSFKNTAILVLICDAINIYYPVTDAGLPNCY